MIRTWILALSFFVLSTSSVQFAQTPHGARGAGTSSTVNNKTMIGPIKKEHISDGCGCTYSLKDNRKRTVYSDDFDGNIWMNIDGKDVKLKLVSSVSIPKGEVRKGQRTTSNYTAPGIRVRTVIVVGKDYGEGHDYAGSITVMRGASEQMIQVVGSCGC